MVTIMNTLFLSNSATALHSVKKMSYEGGAVSCKNGCILTFFECNFIDNYAGIIEKTKMVYSKENVSIGAAVSVSDWSHFTWLTYSSLVTKLVILGEVLLLPISAMSL